jgi:hypothetical protein
VGKSDAFVSRTSDGLDHVNTLAPPLEIRRIVVAQGKQFRNGDTGALWSIPEILRLSGKERLDAIDAIAIALGAEAGFAKKHYPSLARLPAVPLIDNPAGGFLHISLRQGVIFSIEVVNTKEEFVKSLLDPGLHLIYSGHARFGRGPCFGAGGKSRGEEWEEGHGKHPNADGIFRMGFPFLSVPADEPIEHGYTANLVKSSVSLTAPDCDPDLRAHLGGLRARTLAEIDKATTSFATKHGFSDTFVDHVRDKDPDATWWTHGRGDAMRIVLHANWKSTASRPDDLDSLDPLCRVFCHFGCSTFKHNFPVVRKLKGWKKAGNERYAYWTTDVSFGITDIYWLQHLLTFPEFNAGEPWEKSLAYAVRKTNGALASDRQKYRVI